jgi:REP element-mobilizing transposase RayT
MLAVLNNFADVPLPAVTDGNKEPPFLRARGAPMPRTARKQSASSLYHVMNRGVGKQIIYEDDNDKGFFLSRLDDLLVEHHASLLAWCLLDNHFHLLLDIPFQDLPPYMHRLLTGYAGYFNRVHDHAGALFGGRYGSECVDTDEYLMTCVRYIHENPIKARLSKSLDYKWSSFREYKVKSRHVDPDLVLRVFGSRNQLLRFHYMEHEDDQCMDYGVRHTVISDKHALEVAKAVLGKDGVLAVKGMDRDGRNEALVQLRESGLGVRQIQRLTGVSKSIISRVTGTGGTGGCCHGGYPF